ncbi:MULTISPECIES: NUDIX hydrolase [Prochlorococcus]|uniref:NUDIX hydrolase n=1 Tax=Prochlorococcus TaxID=1218 RepID=UPI0005339458|nr:MULTISPECIES: NUDIX hydrolase [Prochlorococcus]KGG13079.1 ADP-ribose pyrophosphatasee [Prochlorococcus sp. MIT 0601]
MSPLPPQEPSLILENKRSIDVKKIRFEVNRIELPIGFQGTFGVIKHPGAALAVPIKENGNVIILRQYRFAVSRRILEFPAGTLENNEDPLSSIQRELGEESGYEASNWDELGVMLPCPGYSDESIHMFLARDLSPLQSKPLGDEDEDIEILELTKNELDKIISNGNEALDGKTITAWHRACQFLDL